jgi:hypothetical protein
MLVSSSSPRVRVSTPTATHPSSCGAACCPWLQEQAILWGGDIREVLEAVGDIITTCRLRLACAPGSQLASMAPTCLVLPLGFSLAVTPVSVC